MASTPGAGLKVLFVASECAPFAKTGGLADVVGALPKALRAARHRRARGDAALPRHPLERAGGARGHALGADRPRLRPRARAPGPAAQERRAHLLPRAPPLLRPRVPVRLGRPRPTPTTSSASRFLSRGALQLCKALGWYPDVVHANDWQTALVPVYVNTVEWAQPLHGAASVYTIHNLAYQGVADRDALAVTGLGPEHDNPNEFEHFGTLNLTKAALAHATLVTTVSPTYAREIQTPEYGYGLDGVLRGRSGDLVGIVNGIDPRRVGPRHRPAPARALLRATTSRGKAVCKAALQKEAGLPVRPERAALRPRGAPRRAEGHRRARAGARPHPGPRPADRAARHRRPRRRGLLRAGRGRAPRPLLRLAALRQRPRPPHRGRRGLLPDAVALRALRAQPALQPRLRHAADRARHRRPRRHGARLLRGDRQRHGLLLPRSDARAPSSTRWAGRVSTWYDRPRHVAAMRREAMAEDFSWQHAAKEYQRVYLRAYEKRRGHPFGSAATAPPPAAPPAAPPAGPPATRPAPAAAAARRSRPSRGRAAAPAKPAVRPVGKTPPGLNRRRG